MRRLATSTTSSSPTSTSESTPPARSSTASGESLGRDVSELEIIQTWAWDVQTVERERRGCGHLWKVGVCRSRWGRGPRGDCLPARPQWWAEAPHCPLFAPPPPPPLWTCQSPRTRLDWAPCPALIDLTWLALFFSEVSTIVVFFQCSAYVYWNFKNV